MSKSVNFFLSSRNMLFQILKCNCPVICFNAKDFVRTVLQFFGGDGSWKHGKLSLMGWKYERPRAWDWCLEREPSCGAGP